MLKLCMCREGPFWKKGQQVSSLPTGTIITMGWRPRWIEPSVQKDIELGQLSTGMSILVCSAVLDSLDAWIEPLRLAQLVQVKDYSCPHCRENDAGFIRFDMELLDGKLPDRIKPTLDTEGFLVLP